MVLSRKLILAFVCTAHLNLAFSVKASEVDPYMFLKRAELKDSVDELNFHLNYEIRSVLEKQNKTGHFHSCEKTTYQIGAHFIQGLYNENITESWVLQNPYIQKYPLPEMPKETFFKDSIYGFRDKARVLGYTVRMNNVDFGTDKILHFITMGFVYAWTYNHKMQRFLNKTPFEVADKKSKERIINLGIRSEETLFGKWTTGVFSFADLEANYQGFLLYNSFCEGETSRLEFSDKGWVLARPVDMREYINPNWDESFNNSYFMKYFDQIKERILTYCSGLDRVKIQNRMRNYDKNNSLSENMVYLKKLVEEKRLPDPSEHSLRAICPGF